MKISEDIEKMISAGAKRWTKGGHDRLYLNAEQLGMMDIASEIKSIRLRTGLTQTEFGQRLGGIPLRTIQNWENGERACPPYVLELIRFRVEHDDSIPKRQ